MAKIITIQCEKETRTIEVPLLSFGFDINNYGGSSELMYMIEIESTTSNNLDETLRTIELPKGNWKIIAQ